MKNWTWRNRDEFHTKLFLQCKANSILLIWLMICTWLSCCKVQSGYYKVDLQLENWLKLTNERKVAK